LHSSPDRDCIAKGTVLRKFALLVSACIVFLFAGFAAAQQVDIMAGGSIPDAFPPKNSSATLQQPTEKEGLFVGVSADYIAYKRFKRRYGLNVETAWKYKRADYPYNGETYRNYFSDVNALYQPNVGKLGGRQVGLDFLGGIGVATTTFNLPPVSYCSLGAGGCTTYTTSNHFMEHLGFGIRYNFWRRFFVRPEAHYYHIQNNFQFTTDSVFRIGASVGYRFGPK
jgi:hypothetical protein